MSTELVVPDLALVVLVGASGAGKSTFAARHFAASEVVSSDECRRLVADDDNDQSATPAAFELLHFIAAKRLAGGRLTVVDATSVTPAARRSLVEVARAAHVLPVAVVLDVPERVCLERNRARPDRAFGPEVVRRQRDQLRRSIRTLEREGFRRVWVLRDPAEVDEVTVVRERRWTDRRADTGPFDVVGDVHGCIDELRALLERLGYAPDPDGRWRHPAGRTAVFVGDLVDRGPDSPAVLRLVMAMRAAGTAICVPGNHEQKLARVLRGRSAQVSHGLELTLAQIEATGDDELADAVVAWVDGLRSHVVLDGGRLVVAHAGLPEAMHNRASAAVRAFALYGDTTGETDDYGLPVRYPWAVDYRGAATVVYGHTPVPEPVWLNDTICVDTGCVFGGRLTALRWPERTLESVPAATTYYEPVRPLAAPPAERRPGILDLADVTGKRIVTTGLVANVTVREDDAVAALEVMSRFAIDPRWLVYLPPTMSPPATHAGGGLLEHPDEAFDAYRRDGVTAVVCEEKHMGSRAVAVVARDPAVAAARFGVDDGRAGVVHTRTGRAFFADPSAEAAVVARLGAAAASAGLWDELGTDWVVLDGELLPWSLKAGGLIRDQYASVGAAARHAAGAAVDVLARTAARGIDVADLAGRQRDRAAAAEAFTAAYRPFVAANRPVAADRSLTADPFTADPLTAEGSAGGGAGPGGARFAPFQILAGEAGVHATEPHDWHLRHLDRLVAADPGLLLRTDRRAVDLADLAAVADAVAWWEARCAAGGEGMVVKPTAGVTAGPRGLTQPGIKCRGPEHLRLVYGPEYLEAANLDRLRQRNVGRKRSLAQREHALGLEALTRFVDRAPLWRVHECVFAVLALETEPVDPRL